MCGPRNSKWIVALATCAGVALAGVATQTAFARGGGHGGGHHGGGHHGGGHHGHHPYHPSHHHTAHHDHHHDHHHYHHHHHSWHHGGWGPGFWGGLGLGAVGGWYGGNYWGGGGYGGYGGGDTYVDNSSNATPSDAATQNAGNTPTDSTANQQPGQTANTNGFPVDDWPELGVVTYAGEYGQVQGMVVVRVVPNSSAAKAGIVPGDVILKLNNQPTPNADALESVLDAAKSNFEATVWDARTGRTSMVSGALEAAPADLQENEDDAAGVQPKPSAS
jgi:hypothetical protein